MQVTCFDRVTGLSFFYNIKVKTHILVSLVLIFSFYLLMFLITPNLCLSLPLFKTIKTFFFFFFLKNFYINFCFFNFFFFFFFYFIKLFHNTNILELNVRYIFIII